MIKNTKSDNEAVLQSTSKMDSQFVNMKCIDVNSKNMVEVLYVPLKKRGHCGRNTMGMCEYSGKRSRCKLYNLSGHLRNSVRCQIRSTLKESKKSSSKECLEYDFKKFKQHIEKHFQDEMSLNNNGSECHKDT